jgi:N-acetylmuramoyl-L-alanine amidase
MLYNKQVANMVKERLECFNICLFLIEDKDIFERSKIANEFATALVSIHHDSAGRVRSGVGINTPKLSGFSIFISKLNPQYKDSLRLAKCIGAELIRSGFWVGFYHKNTRNKQRLLVDKNTGVYRADKFAVLKDSKIPAVLIECGVISNATEEQWLNENRGLMADAIALGIQKYMEQWRKN